MRKYKSAAQTGTDENRRKVAITKNPAPLMLISSPAKLRFVWQKQTYD